MLGQALGDAGTRPLLLAVAAVTAAPATGLVHRALGAATTLAASAGAIGAVQVWRRERARSTRSTGLPRERVELRGRVAGVRPHRARGGGTGASLDVYLTEARSGLHAGEIVRVAIWKTAREWLVGDDVTERVVLRAPRGFCNDGRDAYARAAWRQGVVAVAALADDRAVRVTPWQPSAGDVGALLAAGRRAIARALLEAVPASSERGVLAALIYGDQGGIPDDLRAAYARTGTAHVLSVSGLHIAVVAATAFVVLRRLMALWAWLALRLLVVRCAAVAALVPVAGYAFLSGGAVATLRALVMGVLGLGAIALVRRADVWSALAAAAVLLCAGDPGIARDVSFQLSFAAVAALVVAGRRYETWRAAGGRCLDPARLAGRLLGAIAGAVVVAVAAALATGPITAYHFGTVAVLGVVANLVVVPLVGWLALLLGLAGAALIPLWSDAAALLLALAAAAIRPGNAFVGWLASVRGSALDVALASATQVGAALAVAATALVARGWPRRAALAAAVLLLGAAAGEALGDRLAPRLVVRFLDVGQGDAILLRPAPGEGLLIDAGGLGGSFDPGARVVAPALRRSGLSELAVMALSHPDHDHHGGLAAVGRALPVAEFWSSGERSESAGYRELTAVLAERGVARRTVLRGVVRALAGGGELRVLHPDASARSRSRNDTSLVVQVAYGASRVLLTGDIEAAAEGALVRHRAEIAATVVKVPHHGSRTSSTRGFVAAARPGLAVALLGARNRFGFPAAEVRRRYQGMGSAWLQSDRAGEVAMTSDGQLEVVETCR
jgi:competence protein ComEC